MVRMIGLEPTHLAVLAPKASVSTNFTTSAHRYPNKEVPVFAIQRIATHRNAELL